VQDPNGSTRALFPMQTDVSARVAVGPVSAVVVGGVRGQVRRNEAIVPLQNYQPIDQSVLISREHWVMWQQGAQGLYARAGRFFAPFGLRLAEHLVYVRRDLGFNSVQESYNLSVGYLGKDWELHATAFAPDFLRHIGSQEKGGAIYLEHRVLDDHGAVAAQAKLASAPGVMRAIGGAVGKYYREELRTLVLAEANVVTLLFDRAAASNQFVGAAEVVVMPYRGVSVTLLGERSQQDLSTGDSAWNAASLLLGWFPYAHVELQVMGRAELPAGGRAARTLFAQLHYYL
jgi:hypothetical protein